VSGRERLAHTVATVFGLGDRLLAPGTFAGSLPAAVLWLALAAATPGRAAVLLLTAAGTLLFTLAGVWAATVDSRRRGREDPGPVVIDEVAGQWLTYLLAAPLLPLEVPRYLVATVLGGFVLFRLFDILKPWPANRLERLAGGVGIMADDLAAGVYAGLVLLAALWLL
jgi:phosphatidylglycerophosphatase A